LISSCHVDDTLLCGTKEEIERFKKSLKNQFNIKDLGLMRKHLGIRYDWQKDSSGNNIVIATMDSLISEIIKVTETTLGRTLNGKEVPGKPGENLEVTDDDFIDDKAYRTIVGKIMYLTNKLMIEGMNAAREMSKFFMRPQKQHWKAVKQFVGYLKQEQSMIMLTYRKPLELRFMAVADSNYATDKHDRKSVSGAIYTLGGTITGWMSKAQDHTTLSSAEAEYAAMSSATQELVFMTNLAEDIEPLMKPGLILGDNEGALALVKNRQVGARTKHIDIRHHFMRDKWEEGLLRVAHIPGEDNEADICTKNVTNRLHLKHRSRIRHGILWLSKLCNHPPIQREDVVISEELD